MRHNRSYGRAKTNRLTPCTTIGVRGEVCKKGASEEWLGRHMVASFVAVRSGCFCHFGDMTKLVIWEKEETEEGARGASGVPIQYVSRRVGWFKLL